MRLSFFRTQFVLKRNMFLQSCWELISYLFSFKNLCPSCRPPALSLYAPGGSVRLWVTLRIQDEIDYNSKIHQESIWVITQNLKENIIKRVEIHTLYHICLMVASSSLCSPEINLKTIKDLVKDKVKRKCKTCTEFSLYSSDTCCHTKLCFMTWFSATRKVSLQDAADILRNSFRQQWSGASAFLMWNGNETSQKLSSFPSK